MWVALQGPEGRILGAERQRLGLREKARGRRRRVEEWPAVDAWHAVGLPELQRIAVAELDGAQRIGRPQEVRPEQVGGRPVEPPVGQGDAWVDRLELALEIQEIGAMPGQEPCRAV